MLQEIMASIEPTKVENPVILGPRSFTKVDLVLDTDDSIEMTKLLVAAEATQNTACALESLLTCSAESLDDQALQFLMSGLNQSLSIAGFDMVTERETKTGKLKEKAAKLWAKVKILIAKALASARKAIRSLFNNAGKLETAHKDALDLIEEMQNSGKVSGSGEVSLKGLDILRVEDGIFEPGAVSKVEEELTTIRRAIRHLTTNTTVSENGNISFVGPDELKSYLTHKHKDLGVNKLSAGLAFSAASDVLPGGRIFVYEGIEREEVRSIVWKLGLVKAKLSKSALDKTTYPADKMATLAKERLEAGLKLIDMAKGLEKDTKFIMDTFDTLLKEVDGEETPAKDIATVRHLASIVVNALTQLSKYVFMLIKANYTLAKRMASVK